LILDTPGSEITTENAKTLAVWMPNSEEVVNTKWQDYIVSVDEVESKTGYNFFAALPKGLQSELEKTIGVGN
jgi:endonuclease G, mitochondrial